MNTFKLSNIRLEKYRKFLSQQGCYYVGTESSHENWYREGLKRRITFQTTIDPIPELSIRTNNRTLGLSRKEFTKLFLKVK